MELEGGVELGLLGQVAVGQEWHEAKAVEQHRQSESHVVFTVNVLKQVVD